MSRLADEGLDDDHGGRQYLWLKVAARVRSGGSSLATGRGHRVERRALIGVRRRH